MIKDLNPAVACGKNPSGVEITRILFVAVTGSG